VNDASLDAENAVCDFCDQQLHEMEHVCNARPVPRPLEDPMAGPFSPVTTPYYYAGRPYPFQPRTTWGPPASYHWGNASSYSAGPPFVARIPPLPLNSHADWDFDLSRSQVGSQDSDMGQLSVNSYASSSVYTGSVHTPPGLSRPGQSSALEPAQTMDDVPWAFDPYFVGEPGPSRPLPPRSHGRQSRSGKRPVE
jgi:hypothetical protein